MSTTFKERVIDARKKMGWSKAELARRSGLTPQNIQQLENGENKGNLIPINLFKLSDTLGVNARWLALGLGPRESSAKIDAEMLARILSEVMISLEYSELKWSPQRIARLCGSLYAIWEQSGECPDVAAAIQLMQLA